MSTSKRETILAAAASALSSVSGATTYRSRVAAFALSEGTGIVVEPVNDVADNPAIHRLLWTLTFQAAIISRADVPDSSADATIVDVHNKIMADATLESLCVNLIPSSVDWQIVQADKTLAVVTMQFRASYQTDVDDITA